jgi:hypothetical protein
MFKYEFMTLTQIGQLFDVSSHKVGAWLVAIGLRTQDKRPSRTAFDGDYVTQGPSRGTGYNWVWHSQRTTAALQKAGHRRISNPPSYLVDPPKLNGPFQKRANDKNGIDILNGDASVAIVVTGEPNADFVVRVLNAAHRTGYLERHLGPLSADAAAVHLTEPTYRTA